jgi:transcriptional regulator with GAF, ATPase, and Fis domain
MDQRLTATRVVNDLKHPRLLRRKVRLEVLQGPDAGKQKVLGSAEINIGTLPANDLMLADSSVSRYHLRISAGAAGFVITDLDSTNGTSIGPLRLREVTVTQPVELKMGDSLVRVTPLSEEVEVPLHTEEHFGKMAGRNPQMRELFAQLVAIASTDATVLIEGETGTGKELLAEEIHRNSSRRDQALIVLDCGSIPENLIESELFGHLRGSYTGAVGDRLGAFELAHKGTLFLDEIGELSPASQPKLLRALESRQVKPVGGNRYKPADVRIIAATNRDLRLGVNEGTFRADLFYRLSVMRLHLPPLRERPEDIELLATKFMNEFWQRLAPGTAVPPLSRETIQRLVSHRWPGNVRELRNFLERVAVMTRSGLTMAPPELDVLPPPRSMSAPAPGGADQNEEAQPDVALPYKEAKMKWVDHFEMAYVSALLRENAGNVAAAARQAGVDRTYLFRLIRKYNIEK